MESTRARALRKVILAVDALLVVAAMFFAYGLHHALQPHVELLKTPPAVEQYAALAYGVLPVWLVLVAFFGLQRVLEQPWTRLHLVWRLVKLHAVGFVVLSTLLFVADVRLNRSIVVLFLGALFGLMYAFRAAVGIWVAYQHRTGQGRERVLLVGLPQTVMSWFVDVAAAEPHPPSLVGYLAPDAAHPGCGALAAAAGANVAPPRLRTPSDQAPRCLGGASELERVLHDEAVDQVLFFPPLNDPALVGELLDQCEAVGVTAAFAIDMLERDRVTPRVVSIFGEPFVAFEAAPKPPEALAAKHAFDVIVAALALVVALPLLLLVALAILLTMGRPVFFAQERVGRFGRRFRMFKFRSMVRDAEAQRAALAGRNEHDGPLFKVRDDPRITWIGRLLRRTSLDELPQLLNVLRGEMSLVGPRPLPVPEQQQLHGWQRRRLSMKPGLTGLWQVSGRSDLGFEEWMRLDLKYVDEWSFRLDLWLLLKTVPHVLSGRGAR